MINHSFNDPTLISSDPTVKNETTAVFRYPCNSLYQCSAYTITLGRGNYLLETWGASGSTGIGNQGGCGVAAAAAWRTGGGYSSGILKVKDTATFFLYLGSSPINGDSNGGYNGGGNDAATNDKSYGGGGGSTDFRTVYSSFWFNTESLKSRFLVAGGSGGSHEPKWGRGGYGGGEVSCDSLKEGSNEGYYSTYSATGGNQVNGGKGATARSECKDGVFGVGGTGLDGGGGGGGWYGGGGGLWGIGGGGGSSFAYHSKSQILPEGYCVSDDFLLHSHTLLMGNETFPSYNGGYQTGNFGNGAARITLLSKPISCNTLLYCKRESKIQMIFIILLYS
jgi:hypothetical protein